MAAKQSNPGVTALIMLAVIIVLLLVFQCLMFALAISTYRVASQDFDSDGPDEEEIESGFEAMEDAAIAICGICMFWPIMLLYVATAFSISLRGRDVYGKKHGLYTIIGFFLGVGGVVSALAGSFFFLIILGGEIGMPLSISLPCILIVAGLFLFIKDIGGLVFGAAGAGIFSISQVLQMVSLMIVLNSEKIQDTKPGLIMVMLAILFSMLGLVLLLVGFVLSFIWMGKNKPLIDEEQAQQLQMQQHQLKLQVEQSTMQKQQLQLQHEQLYIQKQQLQIHKDGMIEEKRKERTPDQTGESWD